MAHKDNLRKQRSGIVINNTSEKREGKMILKNKLAALVLLFISVILVNCNSSENSGNGLIGIVKVNAIELQSPGYGEQDSVAKTVVGGVNDFVFRLSAMLAENVCKYIYTRISIILNSSFGINGFALPFKK